MRPVARAHGVTAECPIGEQELDITQNLGVPPHTQVTASMDAGP